MAANEVDDGRGWDEWVSGILKLRKKLCAVARGNVLESAAGTGRNFEFYQPDNVSTVTLVDVAPQLLNAAKERWDTEDKFAHMRNRVGVRFLVGDLDAEGSEERLKAVGREQGEQVKGTFDTVVQTMGLCSTKDPVRLLKNLGKLVKEDGRILLLEHGKSKWPFINKVLESSAFDHAKKYGCWWDRDIMEIVKESGLEIEEVRRFNLGTTWWFVLRPKQEFHREEHDKPQAENSKTAGKAKQWWS
jgi:methyltransferase OMS1